MKLENGKEYACGIETKFGGKPSFYVRTFKNEDKILFETNNLGYFTKEEFNIFCQAIGSMKCKDVKTTATIGLKIKVN